MNALHKQYVVKNTKIELTRKSTISLPIPKDNLLCFHIRVPWLRARVQVLSMPNRHREYTACHWDESYLPQISIKCREEFLGKLFNVRKGLVGIYQ